MLLQTGPESYRVWLPDGRVLHAVLAHRTRRGLELPLVPPLTVATEMVAFLLERDAVPATDGSEERPVDLGPATLRFPEAVDELRARLG